MSVVGSPSSSWQDVPDLTPRAGEVLVKVSAAGVDRADLLQAAGNYPPPPGASETLGLEVSGTIAEDGQQVDGSGDRATRLCFAGRRRVRQFVAVPEGQVVRCRTRIDSAARPLCPEVTCTVWSNLVITAALWAGQVVLIHGGASGIGTHAMQIARALGSRVAVTAGTPAKLDVCRRTRRDRHQLP